MQHLTVDVQRAVRLLQFEVMHVRSVYEYVCCTSMIRKVYSYNTFVKQFNVQCTRSIPVCTDANNVGTLSEACHC